jgi:anaerobic selenocysteine-containing dehydrogenase
MQKFSRRKFLKLSALSAAMLAIGKNAFGKEFEVLKGTLKLKEFGEDFSPETGKKRKAIPSACWQCVARDGIIGYVEDGRLVKIEGNHRLPRTGGKICAKGQAGINQVYDPDRILYPLKRAGKRGSGRWKRISWKQALDEVTAKLKVLRDKGKPEEFMFHYGRMKASSSKIIKSHFLAAYGTGTIGNHTSICEAAKWTAQELTWGKHYDVNDVARSRFILNFGSNFFEAHTSHIPLYQRAIEAKASGRSKIITFDVRLSNTAALSNEWIPIKPGTDGAVMLAMANIIMQNNLYDSAFIRKWTNVTSAQLKRHLRKYTSSWAEKISGVPAKRIKQIAIAYADTKPATIITYRGNVAHYNGVENERAAQMLEAICGNIDIPGGRCVAVGAKWKNSFKTPKTKTKKLKIVDGLKGDAVYPTHHINHRVLDVIKDGKAGRPKVYMVYCYTPVYANGNVKQNIEILKDEKLIPYLVNVNPFYDETAALSDIILPDATYLERWDWEDMVSYDMIPEYYIRQPMVKPLGEVRDFKDVVCDLAKRLGIPLGFNSAEEFVKDACQHTKGVKEAGGFWYMKKYGAWYDRKGKPKYRKYAKKVGAKDLAKEGVIFDGKTGVYWNWKKSKAKSKAEALKKGYTATKNSYKGYVGQKIGDVVYKGFKPDKINKSGMFEIYSGFLKKKGFNPLPSYIQVPEHKKIGKGELILTTYKVNVQIHSRSQNCKWLTEIYHDNPAWIHPDAAKALGIRNGGRVKIKSGIGEIVTRAQVTEGVHPQVIAVSHHLGHWEYGRYASGKKSPTGKNSDRDLKHKWWRKKGEHPNWIIPNAPDPIAGQLRYMDTVVKVSRG